MSHTGSDERAPVVDGQDPPPSPAQWWILILLLSLLAIVFALAFALFRLAQ